MCWTTSDLLLLPLKCNPMIIFYEKFLLAPKESYTLRLMPTGISIVHFTVSRALLCLYPQSRDAGFIFIVFIL